MLFKCRRHWGKGYGKGPRSRILGTSGRAGGLWDLSAQSGSSGLALGKVGSWKLNFSYISDRRVEPWFNFQLSASYYLVASSLHIFSRITVSEAIFLLLRSWTWPYINCTDILSYTAKIISGAALTRSLGHHVQNLYMLRPDRWSLRIKVSPRSC